MSRRAFRMRAVSNVRLFSIRSWGEEALRPSVPMPGSPWPHDMLITIDGGPNTLVDVLWVREAWNLHPVGDDLPPLLSDDWVRARAQIGSTDAIATWSDAWPRIWNACIDHAGLVQDSTMLNQLQHTLDGAPERIDLLARMFGPSWRGSLGDDAFTDEHGTWNFAQFQARMKSRSTPYGDDPERLALSALIPAWQAGLTKIVTVPCQGSYTRVIGQHTLLVTDETRDHYQRYSEALKLFRS